MERVFVFTVQESGKSTDCFTVIPPEVFTRGGVMNGAIVGARRPGENPGGSVSREDFVPNEALIRLLHRVVADHAPNLAGFQAEAEQIGSGWVYLVDRRTPTPDGPVHHEDILGGFQVTERRVVPGS